MFAPALQNHRNVFTVTENKYVPLAYMLYFAVRNANTLRSTHQRTPLKAFLRPRLLVFFALHTPLMLC